MPAGRLVECGPFIMIALSLAVVFEDRLRDIVDPDYVSRDYMSWGTGYMFSLVAWTYGAVKTVEKG